MNIDYDDHRPFYYHECSDHTLTANKNPDFNKFKNFHLRKPYEPKTRDQAINHLLKEYYLYGE